MAPRGSNDGNAPDTVATDEGSADEPKFGVQLGVGILGKVVTAIIAFVGSIYLARVLGPTGYGAFYLLMAVASLADNPVTGWTNAARKRYREADFPAGEALGSILLVAVGSTVVVGAGAAALAGPIARRTGHELDPVLFVPLYFGLVTFISTRKLLKATDHFGSASWLLGGRDLLRVLGQVALVSLGFGVAGMVAGVTVANLLLVPMVLSLVGEAPRLPSRGTLRSIATYAKSSVPENVVGTALGRMDVLLLGALATTSAVGNYQIAMNVTIPAMFVANVANTGLLGRVSHRDSLDETFSREVRNNLAYVSVVAVPIFFGAVAIGDALVITIYSNSYAQAGTFVAALAGFRVIKSQDSILWATIAGIDRPDLNLRISTGVFVVNLALGIFLWYKLGAIGIVYATVVSAAIGYAGRAIVLRTRTVATLFPRPMLAQLLAGAVMGVTVVVLRVQLGLPKWYSVAGYVAVGAAVYAVVLTLLSREIRETARLVAGDAIDAV